MTSRTAFVVSNTFAALCMAAFCVGLWAGFTDTILALEFTFLGLQIIFMLVMVWAFRTGR